MGMASPWTESSVHVGLTFFPDSLLPPPVAATGRYILALDRASEGTPGLWSLLCAQFLEQMDLLLAVLSLRRRAPATGPSPGRCERTLVLFPGQLFSPALGSLLPRGLLCGFLLAREVERLFFPEEFSFFCSCDHSRLSLYCLTAPDHGVMVCDVRTHRRNESPPCAQIS